MDPDSERLFSPGTRITIVTAHPDDTEFYMGATLARLRDSGAELSLICVTDGDKGYYPFEDPDRNRRIRREEQRRASAMWGTRDVVFLSYPDGRLIDTAALRQDLAREIAKRNPDYLFLFDPLFPPRMSHGDHRRAGAATDAAADILGFTGWRLYFQTSASNFQVDATPYWEEKERLLAVHSSQFFGERLARIEGIVDGIARMEGEKLGVRLAEGFRVLRRP